MLRQFKVRNANPWWRRLLRRLRRWRGGGCAKQHQVHFVWINGHRFKRVTFARASDAAAVAAALEAVAGTKAFPRLVMHDDQQIWTRFVPGRPARAYSTAHRRAMEQFFIRLYRCPAVRTATGTTPFPARLAADLEFLRVVGVINDASASELRTVAEQLRPTHIVVGHDYIDPVLKNFVIADDKAIGIDIEALKNNQLLGTGLAKARLRWLDEDYRRVLDDIAAEGGPDLWHQYQWVELCFLAQYFKQKILQRKPGHIHPEAFAQALASHTLDSHNSILDTHHPE